MCRSRAIGTSPALLDDVDSAPVEDAAVGYAGLQPLLSPDPTLRQSHRRWRERAR